MIAIHPLRLRGRTGDLSWHDPAANIPGRGHETATASEILGGWHVLVGGGMR
jgi:hypothetical protein